MIFQMNNQAGSHSQPDPLRRIVDYEVHGVPVDVKGAIESHVCSLKLPVVCSRPRLEADVDRKICNLFSQQQLTPRIVDGRIVDVRPLAKYVLSRRTSLKVVASRVDGELPAT